MNVISDAEYWKQALEIIAGEVPPIPFQTWFKDTTAAYDGDIFVIVCPTGFAKEWLYSRYSGIILRAVEQATGNEEVKIGFRSLKLPAESVDKSRVALLY